MEEKISSLKINWEVLKIRYSEMGINLNYEIFPEKNGTIAVYASLRDKNNEKIMEEYVVYNHKGDIVEEKIKTNTFWRDVYPSDYENIIFKILTWLEIARYFRHNTTFKFNTEEYNLENYEDPKIFLSIQKKLFEFFRNLKDESELTSEPL